MKLWRKRYILISGLTGAMVLVALSSLQKINMGWALDLKGFITPATFGLIAGTLIGFWHSRVLELKQKLNQAYTNQKDLCENILSTAPVCIFQSKPDGFFRMVNDRFVQTIGHGKDELLGGVVNLKDIYVDYRDRERAVLELKQNGSIQDYHVQLRRKDGETIWLSIFATVRVDEMGTYHDGFGLDITERKHAQEAVRESESRLQHLLHNLQAGVVVHSEDTSVQFANAKASHLLGLSFDQMKGIGITDPTWSFVREDGTPMPQDEYPVFQVKFTRTPAMDIVLGINSPMRSTPTWVLANAYPRFSRGGRLCNIVVTFVDITNLKRAEQDRHHLFQLINNATSIAVMKDLNLRYLNVNRAYLKLTGHESLNGVIGKTDAELFAGVASESQIKEYVDNDQRAMLLPQGEHISCEEHFPDEGEGQRTFLTKKFPIYTEDNAKLSGIGTLSTEITALKRMEQSLRLAKEQAEVANKAKSEFLANMSHEIRTPLNGLMGMLQLLKKTRQDTEQSEYTDHALKSSRRLLRLLTDILDLARVEAGKMHMAIDSFHFEDALDDTIQLFLPTAIEKHLELRKCISPHIPSTLRGDVARLQQVLNNLVGNAIKFTNAGHVELQAHPLPARNNEEYRVLFSVSDTGIGMPEDLLENLFTPFTQAEQSYTRRFQGAGLGLSISKQIVELMDGSMAVESEEGIGSTLHFCATFKRATRVSPNLSTQKPQTDYAGLRILIAEDDRTSKLIAQKLLEKAGLYVETVSDGKQALMALNEKDFDLVLMDVQMPVLDGVETTIAVREGKSGIDNKDIPIIAMTAYAMDGDKEGFLKAGMNGYVAKPVDINELQSVMNDVLEVVL